MGRLKAAPTYPYEGRGVACACTDPAKKMNGGLYDFLVRAILTGSGRIVSFSTMSFTVLVA